MPWPAPVPTPTNTSGPAGFSIKMSPKCPNKSVFGKIMLKIIQHCILSIIHPKMIHLEHFWACWKGRRPGYTDPYQYLQAPVPMTHTGIPNLCIFLLIIEVHAKWTGKYKANNDFFVSPTHAWYAQLLDAVFTFGSKHIIWY